MDVTTAPGFRVDLPLLAEAVAELDLIARKVEAEVPRWDQVRIRQRIGTVGDDPVSVQLRQNMVAMAERFGVWLQEYTAQVRAAHANLGAQHESYLRMEEEIARRMRT